MDNPRNFRVAQRHFLNLPGFHAGAYISAEVEHTSGRAIPLPSGNRRGWAPSPGMDFEIAGRDNHVATLDCTEGVRSRVSTAVMPIRQRITFCRSLLRASILWTTLNASRPA